jgi:hypothetical protein
MDALNKSILDLSSRIESDVGSDSTNSHRALACSMRREPSMARQKCALHLSLRCRFAREREQSVSAKAMYLRFLDCANLVIA